MVLRVNPIALWRAISCLAWPRDASKAKGSALKRNALSDMPKGLPKKKGPLAMSKRPKSREETPKEGSDSARRYRTATICGRAAQKARVFRFFPMQIAQG